MSLAKLKEQLAPVFARRAEVLVAYLFGSAIGGHRHRESDLDIAVLVDPNRFALLDAQAPYGYQAELTAELCRTLHTSRVDLVLLHRASPLLAHEVIRRGELLFCRDELARHSFEVATKLRYLDTKHLRAIKRRYLYGRLDQSRAG